MFRLPTDNELAERQLADAKRDYLRAEQNAEAHRVEAEAYLARAVMLKERIGRLNNYLKKESVNAS